MPRILRSLLFVVALLATLPGWGPAGRLHAQNPQEFRVGISFGGISFVGFLMEYRWGDRSVDLNIGTWAFRDLSVSVVGKQYFGPGDFRPFAGLGVWMVVTPFHRPEEQPGIAFLLRGPVGAEWNLGADHHLGFDISLNRALWVQRKDPRDDTPPAPRLVPLPGFHYRWKR